MGRMTRDQKQAAETELNKAYTAYKKALHLAQAPRFIVERFTDDWRFTAERIWRQ